jgi:hypothetical protein
MDGQEKKSERKKPITAQRFETHNQISVFVYSRPLKKTNEVKDLFIVAKFYVTKNSFPFVSRRSVVVKTRYTRKI